MKLARSAGPASGTTPRRATGLGTYSSSLVAGDGAQPARAKGARPPNDLSPQRAQIEREPRRQIAQKIGRGTHVLERLRPTPPPPKRRYSMFQVATPAQVSAAESDAV